MKNAIVFGMGNIGRVLVKRLAEERVNVKYVVRSDGVFDPQLRKIAEKDQWKDLSGDIDMAFICIPTDANGDRALEYASYFLKQGKAVISCEKAAIAYHWDVLKECKDLFKYTASVGGGTRMLKEVSWYGPEDFKEIKAVVNGTLNYISWAMHGGVSKETVVKEILKRGYAEPGATSFEEIIEAELNDVVLKTIIIANHSGMFGKTMTKEDIHVVRPDDASIVMKRCFVHITRKKIEAGFMEDNDGDDSDKLPDGILNVLYINGGLKASGPGAGAEETVSAMITDMNDLFPDRS